MGTAPGVTFGDAGEFVAAGASLSIPHSPGYPLFALALKAWGSLFPWASWAYRANLFSVACAAAALSLFTGTLRMLGLGFPARLFAAAALGLSASWLHNSLQTEVFSLNALFAVLCLRIAVSARGDFFQPRFSAAFGLVLGLGGGNHHSLIFIVPAVLAGALQQSRLESGQFPSMKKSLSSALYGLSFGALGLLVYAYLPIRSRTGPFLDWGHPVDMQSFLHVLLRKDYGSFSLTVDGSSPGGLAPAAAQTLRFLNACWSGLGPAACLAALAGAILSPVRALLPGALLLCAGPGFLILGNPPFDPVVSGALERFYLMPWLGAAWLAALGIQGLSERTPLPSFAALIFLPIFVFSSAAKAASWAQRWDLAAEDYGRNLLRSLPQGSSLFIDGGDDSFYTIANLLYAQGKRPDIAVHDRGGLVFRSPYGRDFRSLTKAEKEARRIQAESSRAESAPAAFYATLNRELIPGRSLPLWGLLRRIPKNKDAAPSKIESELPQGRALWQLYPRRFDQDRAKAYYRYRALIPFYGVMEAQAFGARGDSLRALLILREAVFQAGDSIWMPGTASAVAQWIGYESAKIGSWAAAEEAYRLAIRLSPRSGDQQLNLGVALERLGRIPEAESAYLKGAQLSPDSYQAAFNLGALYWKSERWEEAARWFGTAARLSNDGGQAASFAMRAAGRTKK